MGARFLATVLAATLAMGLAAPAAGQAPETPGDTDKWVEPPSTLPNVGRSDPEKNLDFLFGALKVAPDEESAKVIEHRIWALWMISRSDTANLLMSRVRKAVEDKDIDLALKLLDAIVKIRPDYVEAWNRRATIHYMKRNYGQSIADIREVLRREPRHFGAWSGLGLILREIGNDEQALEAFRRALAVHPRLERIPEMVEKLTVEVEGRGI